MDVLEPPDFNFPSDGLTLADIDGIRTELSEKCSAVSAYLLSSKDPTDRRRFIGNTVQELFTAFNQVSAAYLKVCAVVQTAERFQSNLTSAIKTEIANVVKETLPALNAPMSYAGMAKSALKHDSVNVKVTNGPTVLLPNTISVVIGPKSSSASHFSSAEDTRKAVMKAVKPKEVDMRVNKVVGTRNNAVRIIADNIDVAKLKTCPALEAAGLEVKERERLNPRLVIRDVPTDINNADLITDIVALNLEADSNDAVKIVYRYPSRQKNGLASVVIETNADIRRKLLSKGRICLTWQSCKVEDHLRVLQCYKCQAFGHLAKNCTASAVCGHCAGAHDTSSCTAGASSIRCHNCVTSKLPNIDHKAFDALKCPIIKRRLTEKAKNIAY